MNAKKLMHSRFMKNTKAISPIFATLILIAIAVIAGIVVYMFTSGYLSNMAGSTSTIQDKAAVPGASCVNTGDAQALVTNMGTESFVVTGMLLKDNGGNVLASTTDVTVEVAGVATTPAGTVAAGTTADVTATFAIPTAPATLLTDGQTYTITITTSGGGSFVSSPFTA